MNVRGLFQGAQYAFLVGAALWLSNPDSANLADQRNLGASESFPFFAGEGTKGFYSPEMVKNFAKAANLPVVILSHEDLANLSFDSDKAIADLRGWISKNLQGRVPDTGPNGWPTAAYNAIQADIPQALLISSNGDYNVHGSKAVAAIIIVPGSKAFSDESIRKSLGINFPGGVIDESLLQALRNHASYHEAGHVYLNTIGSVNSEYGADIFAYERGNDQSDQDREFIVGIRALKALTSQGFFAGYENFFGTDSHSLTAYVDTNARQNATASLEDAHQSWTDMRSKIAQSFLAQGLIKPTATECLNSLLDRVLNPNFYRSDENRFPEKTLDFALDKTGLIQKFFQKHFEEEKRKLGEESQKYISFINDKLLKKLAETIVPLFEEDAEKSEIEAAKSFLAEYEVNLDDFISQGKIAAAQNLIGDRFRREFKGFLIQPDNQLLQDLLQAVEMADFDTPGGKSFARSIMRAAEMLHIKRATSDRPALNPGVVSTKVKALH